MLHKCNGFCLKFPNKKHTKDKRRICKVGCGQETEPMNDITPGFPLLDSPAIARDHRQTMRLYMPRNHPRLNQTSADLLQCWRGNCDVQILIFSGTGTSNFQFDPEEIARVTDYVVAYSCKGNKTLKEERDQNSAFTLRLVFPMLAWLVSFLFFMLVYPIILYDMYMIYIYPDIYLDDIIIYLYVYIYIIYMHLYVIYLDIWYHDN